MSGVNIAKGQHGMFSRGIVMDFPCRNNILMVSALSPRHLRRLAKGTSG